MTKLSFGAESRATGVVSECACERSSEIGAGVEHSRHTVIPVCGPCAYEGPMKMHDGEQEDIICGNFQWRQPEH